MSKFCMALIGYARVSTDDQNLALQLDALRDAGCAPVFEDTVSGASPSRPGFVSAVAACGPGDVLTVWKLDRLGRSMAELVDLVGTLQARGAGVRVLTGAGAAIDTTRAEGRFVFGIFAALAEFERELIRERTKAGMASARRRGRHVGRPVKLSPERLAHAKDLIAGGRGKAEVAALLGVGAATLRRALKA